MQVRDQVEESEESRRARRLRIWGIALVAAVVLLLLGTFLAFRTHEVSDGTQCGSAYMPSEGGNSHYVGHETGCESVLNDARVVAFPIFGVGFILTVGIGVVLLIRSQRPQLTNGPSW